jgi:hypothetical protein
MAKPVTDFETLQKIWYKKLKESGFEDIEKPDGQLKVRSALFNSKSFLKTIDSKITYYYLADDFLHTHTFTNSLEQTIWEYHINAISTRDIAKILRAAGIKRKGRWTVWNIVKELRAKMKYKYKVL